MAGLVASMNATAITNAARSMMGHSFVWDTNRFHCGEYILSVSAVAVTAKEVADENGADEHEADHHDRAVPFHAGQGQAAAEGLDQGESEDGPQDGALAAEDAGPAEDDGGDDVELDPGAHVGARRRDARDEDDRGEPRHEPGGGVDEEPGAIHLDSRKTGRRLVRAHAVGGSSEGGEAQRSGRHENRAGPAPHLARAP